MPPGSGAYECEKPLNTLVDICLGRQVENQSPGRVGMRAVEVLDALYVRRIRAALKRCSSTVRRSAREAA